MSKEINYKGSVGYVQKCGGIPAYPAKHPRLDKMLESISDERIRNRENSVKKFLEKYGL